MKSIAFSFLFVFLISSCTAADIVPIDTPTPAPLEISYPDTTLPSVQPQQFGEDFFSGTFHSTPVFSADGKKMWWAGDYRTAKIYFSEFEDNQWKEPKSITFSESIKSYRDPFIAPDGNKFYFISEKTYPGSEVGSRENIWMMEKLGDEWSEPKPLPESINSLELHWTISVDNHYNLYFAASKNRNFDIFVSTYENGNYSDPVNLDMPISSDDREFTPNIAPDGSYILFSRMPLTNDIPALYISYWIDGRWSEPMIVENIPYCISPIVTPDRKYVIFMNGPNAFGWRDTSFIELLRP